MTLDPEESGTKRTLKRWIFPHSSRIFMLPHTNSSHEEQHMNENKICRHMRALQDTSYALFYALSLLPTLDV